MGAALNQKPQTPVSKEIFAAIRQRKLPELNYCIDIIRQDFGLQTTFNKAEFEDVFCSYFDETDVIFENLSYEPAEGATGQEGKVVDVFETLATLSILGNDTFENKVGFLFSLFDFDSSGSIEKPELVMTFQSCVRGLCRFLHMRVPETDLLEVIARSCFSAIDRDFSRKIDLNEFTTWIKENNEIQEFLVRYSSTQTVEFARKKCDVLYKEMDYCFFKVSEVKANDQYAERARADLPKLREALKGAGNDAAVVDILIDIMISTSEDAEKNGILHPVFHDVVTLYTSFRACDVNENGVADVNELKMLIMLYEGEEPSPYRFQAALDELKKGPADSITFKEWMDFMCTVDGRTGKRQFSTELWKLFHKYDQNKAGSLSRDELKAMLMERFRKFVNASLKNPELLENFAGIITAMCDDVIKSLEEESRIKDQFIQWTEFKQLNQKCNEILEKYKSFLKENT